MRNLIVVVVLDLKNYAGFEDNFAASILHDHDIAALDSQALARGGRQRDLAAAGYNKRLRHFGAPALDDNAHTVAYLRNFGNAAQPAEARVAAQKVNARQLRLEWIAGVSFVEIGLYKRRAACMKRNVAQSGAFGE